MTASCWTPASLTLRQVGRRVCGLSANGGAAPANGGCTGLRPASPERSLPPTAWGLLSFAPRVQLLNSHCVKAYVLPLGYAAFGPCASPRAAALNSFGCDRAGAPRGGAPRCSNKTAPTTPHRETPARDPQPAEGSPLHPRGGGKTPLPQRPEASPLDRLPRSAKRLWRLIAYWKVGALPPAGQRSDCAGACGAKNRSSRAMRKEDDHPRNPMGE
jgi:hypothetical protein